ncbi:histone-lysine N-methyltransferase SETMAR [Trichonephila clavipes]|nr:histone-lysine N-methyltransferase SETMAR [Trichonephila clavipes]
MTTYSRQCFDDLVAFAVDRWRHDCCVRRVRFFCTAKATDEGRQIRSGYLPLRIVYRHAVEPSTTVNDSYYTNVLRTMVQYIKRKRPLLRNGFLLHHDNARPHIARCVLDVSQQSNVEILSHPPYSSDLTPCGFWLFRQLKKSLRGKRFASNKACVKTAEVVLKQLSQNGLVQVFKKWTKFWDKCITCHGSYFEKKTM